MIPSFIFFNLKCLVLLSIADLLVLVD